MNPVLGQKLGWVEDGSADLKYLLISVVGMTGVAIGSLFGSKFIELNGKKSINSLFYKINFVAIIACLLKMVMKFETVMVGRFLHGICSGSASIVLGKILNDTIPN